MTVAPRSVWEPVTAAMFAELADRWPDTRRLWKAIVLAPRLAVCGALLAGESVPVVDLDPEWVARLGRRP